VACSKHHWRRFLWRSLVFRRNFSGNILDRADETLQKNIAPGFFFHRLCARAATVLATSCLFSATTAIAQQFDIHGPTDSVAFGTAVAVLPNGNIMVTDPYYGAGTNIGAVYLYSPSGMQIGELFFRR
jgi:hypothetical protein